MARSKQTKPTVTKRVAQAKRKAKDTKRVKKETTVAAAPAPEGAKKPRRSKLSGFREAKRLQQHEHGALLRCAGIRRTIRDMTAQLTEEQSPGSKPLKLAAGVTPFLQHYLDDYVHKLLVCSKMVADSRGRRKTRRNAKGRKLAPLAESKEGVEKREGDLTAEQRQALEKAKNAVPHLVYADSGTLLGRHVVTAVDIRRQMH
jgi:hypothetical protein